MRNRLHPRDESEAGFTLVELVVTMLILGVIGTMLSAWFVAGVRTAGGTVARNDEVFASRNAMQRLTRDLQLAVPDPAAATTTGPISQGTRSSISFYTKITGTDNPGYVTWSVSNVGTYKGTLTRAYAAPVVNASTGAVTWPTTVTQELVRGVNNMNDGKTPDIFRYLDATNSAKSQLCADSATPTACAATTATLVAAPLTYVPQSGVTALTATAPTVDSVEIYLQIVSKNEGKSSSVAPYYETNPRGGPPLVLRARVFPLANTLIATS